MLTKVMARELGPFGVRVNCIAPGYVQTRFSEGLWSNEERMKERMPKIPLRRISQPEEVGRVALFLLSNASAYITGQTLVMDGGQTI